MSEFKESSKLNWRQLSTKIGEIVKNIFSSFVSMVDELKSVCREIGAVVMSISGFGWTLFRKPYKNVHETVLIMVPAVVLLVGVVFNFHWIYIVATFAYLVLFITLSAAWFYSLQEKVVKWGWLWYILGMSLIIFSLIRI